MRRLRNDSPGRTPRREAEDRGPGGEEPHRAGPPGAREEAELRKAGSAARRPGLWRPPPSRVVPERRRHVGRSPPFAAERGPLRSAEITLERHKPAQPHTQRLGPASGPPQDTDAVRALRSPHSQCPTPSCCRRRHPQERKGRTRGCFTSPARCGTARRRPALPLARGAARLGEAAVNHRPRRSALVSGRRRPRGRRRRPCRLAVRIQAAGRRAPLGSASVPLRMRPRLYRVGAAGSCNGGMAAGGTFSRYSQNRVTTVTALARQTLQAASSR